MVPSITLDRTAAVESLSVCGCVRQQPAASDTANHDGTPQKETNQKREAEEPRRIGFRFALADLDRFINQYRSVQWLLTPHDPPARRLTHVVTAAGATKKRQRSIRRPQIS